MSEYDLGFCVVKVVHPQIAVFQVKGHVEEISRKHMVEIERLMEQILTKPYAIIADRRGTDYSLSSCALDYAIENPGSAVMGTVSDNPITADTLYPLELAVVKHRVFAQLDDAIAWAEAYLARL